MPRPSLTPELFFDLIDRRLTAIDICNRHELAFDQLETVVQSPDFKGAIARLRFVEHTRCTATDTLRRTAALRTLEDIAAQQPTCPTHSETIRLAAAQILRVTNADPNPEVEHEPDPEYNPDPEPTPGPNPSPNPSYNPDPAPTPPPQNGPEPYATHHSHALNHTHEPAINHQPAPDPAPNRHATPQTPDQAFAQPIVQPSAQPIDRPNDHPREQPPQQPHAQPRELPQPTPRRSPQTDNTARDLINRAGTTDPSPIFHNPGTLHPATPKRAPPPQLAPQPAA